MTRLTPRAKVLLMEPNYVQRVIDALNEELPGQDPELIKLYALVALTWGPLAGRIEVHDAWALWRNDTKPDHQSLIPYAQLSPEVQELDDKYVEAIRKVAWKLGL